MQLVEKIRDLKEGDRVEVYEDGLGDSDAGTVEKIWRKTGKVDGRPVRGQEVIKVEIRLDNRKPITISAENADMYRIYRQ